MSKNEEILRLRLEYLHLHSYYGITHVLSKENEEERVKRIMEIRKKIRELS